MSMGGSRLQAEGREGSGGPICRHATDRGEAIIVSNGEGGRVPAGKEKKDKGASDRREEGASERDLRGKGVRADPAGVEALREGEVREVEQMVVRDEARGPRMAKGLHGRVSRSWFQEGSGVERSIFS